MNTGLNGQHKMIDEDIRLAKKLFDIVAEHRDLEAYTTNLSITTFRYNPHGVAEKIDLNALNEKILSEIIKGGELFLSNAVIDGRFLMRACVVNYKTTSKDIEAIPEIVCSIGERVLGEM